MPKNKGKLPSKQEEPTKQSINRRGFLKGAAKSACAVSLGGLLMGWQAEGAKTDLPADAIRPPGAKPETMFHALCLRCGQCVRACPYDTLKLANVGDNTTIGLPYFVAREIPCEMCEDIPCVKACPSEALDHELTDINKARMGLAVLVDQETCIAFQGLRCEVCYNACPVTDKAITMELQSNPRTGKHALFLPKIHSDACTGCGKCELVCILEQSAIKILPLKLAKGESGSHYRLGWDEKEKAGGSLVAPDLPHEYYLPEGMDYRHNQGGLIQKENPTTPSPFGGSALDKLNRKFGE
jgi:ferredoxin-type protein NapG